MKTKVIALMILCLLAPLASADVWQDLAKYEYGADPNTAAEAFKVLTDTPADQRAPIEEKLIAVVADKNATRDGKAFACRMLQRIGTEKCIPALSELLEDEVLSHYARLALQRMVGSPKAAEALRAALDKAPDKVKVGILGSIGELRDAQAVQQASKLAGSADAAVAAAAMTALGKIGNQASAACLQKLQAPAELNQKYLDALIDCSKRLGGAEAVPLCKKALAANSPSHTVAAMQGLAAADPDAGVAMIVDALRSDEPRARRGALDAVVIVKSERLTKAVAAKLGDLPAANRAELITALGSRGDKAALGAVSEYVGSDDAAVRNAAIGAAGRLGNAGTVTVLLGLGTTGDIGGKVKDALGRMQAAGVDDALILALADDKTRAAAIQVLAARRCTTATPKLLALVKDKDADIRKEAWAGLAALGAEQDMAAVMKAAVEVEDADELSLALKTVKKVYATASDKGACFAGIIEHYGKATDPIKETLLTLGAGAGNDAALDLERKALKSDNEDLQKAAIRALSAWPNAKAADDLYRLATSGKQDVQQILALRGYIGLAASDEIRMSGGDRIAMLKKVAGVLKRDDEKKLVISGLAKTKSTAGFAMLTQYMEDAAVKKEAEVAAANLLWDVKGAQSAETKAIAQRLLQSEDKGVRQKVGAVISDWSKYKSYLTAWLIAGPFPEKGNGKDVFKKAFPPETDDKGVVWDTLTKGIGRESTNLEAQLGGLDNCCAYVKTTVDSPTEQTVRLEMGSDDSIKAWLNGKLVHSNAANRGVRPGQDVVTVTLKKGRNALMLKIVDNTSQWAFSCRMRDEKGMPLEGISVSAE